MTFFAVKDASLLWFSNFQLTVYISIIGGKIIEVDSVRIFNIFSLL